MLEFMRYYFPWLLGSHRQQRPIQVTFEPMQEENHALHAFRYALLRIFMWYHYHPRSSELSGMWVKDRFRAWFYDFLCEYDDDRWLQIMKMKSGLFNWLCNALAPKIEKVDTNYRKALPVPLRVGAVLYKLLWTATTREVTEGFGIGDSTLYDLLHEVVPTIISVLGCHLSWEEGDAVKKTISENLIRSGIPNVLGAIDCTHVRIQAPSGDGKFDYRNRHGYYSMVMQAVVNSEAKFLDVYIGEPGSMNTAGY